MRAAVYIRVSTDEQAKEGFSLGAQEDRCKSFLQSQGWELHKVYMDDGYSAKDLNRPDMKQMLKDMENQEFNVVVVYRLDRMTRSVIDLHHLLKVFDQHRVSFKSVTEVFDTTTAMGRFLITLVGAMAQWERENLAERVSVALEKRFNEGKRNGGRAPFGYQFSDEGKLVIDPTEAKIVKRIFEMARYYGPWSIAKKLNQEGIKTQNGSEWAAFTVQYLIKNPIYIGNIRWRYSTGDDKVMINDGDHEPIISLELFNEVQQKLEDRKDKSAKALTSDYPFSSIVYCGRCGSALIGGRRKRDSGNGIRYFYKCNSLNIRGSCDLPYVSEQAIENALFKSIQWFVDTSDFTPPEEENNTRNIQEIQREIEQTKKRRKKWQLAYAEDAITLEELKERTGEDRQREKDLLEELESIIEEEKIKADRLSDEEFREIVENLDVIWENATRRERKEIIHQIFKTITIDVNPDSERLSRRGRARTVKIVSYEFI